VPAEAGVSEHEQYMSLADSRRHLAGRTRDTAFRAIETDARSEHRAKLEMHSLLVRIEAWHLYPPNSTRSPRCNQDGNEKWKRNQDRARARPEFGEVKGPAKLK
jgi:hypothetical protein